MKTFRAQGFLAQSAAAAGLLMLALALNACSGPQPTRNSFEPKAQVNRVISLVPALTEITYALGQQDRLVGVSYYCKYPPEAAQKPKVGALINANYESVLKLRPDCVLLRPEQEDISKELAGLGVASVRLPLSTIADTLGAVDRLGELFDCREAAASVKTRINRDLGEARSQAIAAFGNEDGDGSRGRRPTVLFVVGRNPGTLQQIYAAGTGSFIEQLIRVGGGRNVLTHTALEWPVIGKESILALDPDVILDGSYLVAGEGASDDALVPWQQLGILRAVREGRVVAVDDDHMMIPGPEIGQAAMRLGALLRSAFPEKSWPRADSGEVRDVGDEATSATAGM